MPASARSTRDRRTPRCRRSARTRAFAALQSYTRRVDTSPHRDPGTTRHGSRRAYRVPARTRPKPAARRCAGSRGRLRAPPQPRRAHPPSVARGRRESCCPSRPARARRSRALERDRADTEKASARRPPASPSQRANSPRAQRGREARASPRTESLLDNRRSTKPPSQLFGTGSRSPL